MKRRFAWLITLLAAACSPRATPPAGPSSGSAAGAWSGQIVSYVVDHRDRTEVLHRLRENASALPRPLIFADGNGGDLIPGSRIQVWGTAAGDAIRVTRYAVLPDASAGTTSSPAPLIAGEKKPTRRWAFVLVDVDGGGNKVDKVKAQDVLFSPNRPDSIRSYFREVSYGLQDLDGQVFGPFPYAMGGRCDTDRLTQALLPMIPGRFDQYLWFFGTQQAACDWAGIAELGQAERPTHHSWYNAANSCSVLVQEPGHNFGMVHSSAMHCTLAGQPVTIAWPDQGTTISCANEEYGNIFDPMGGGDCYHMNGVQKAYQDWLSGCNIVKATESGTFTIYPLESSCDGPQLLQVPFPKPRAFGKAGILSGYYLELRAPVGYRDRELDPQVLVVVGNDVRDAKFTGNRNWLLDMAPQTPEVDDAALVVGQRFEDALPGGPKFTLLSFDATKAVIKVEIAGSTADATQPGHGVCSDMTAFTPPGPTTCVTPATPAAGPPADAGARADGPGSGGGDSDPGAPSDAGSPGSGTGGMSGSGTAGTSGGGQGGPLTAGASGNGSTVPTTTAASEGGCRFAPAVPTSSAPTVGLLLLLGLALRLGRRRRPG